MVPSWNSGGDDLERNGFKIFLIFLLLFSSRKKVRVNLETLASRSKCKTEKTSCLFLISLGLLQ